MSAPKADALPLGDTPLKKLPFKTTPNHFWRQPTITLKRLGKRFRNYLLYIYAKKSIIASILFGSFNYFLLFLAGFEFIQVPFRCDFIQNGFNNLVYVLIFAVIGGQSEIDPAVGKQFDRLFFVFAFRRINGDGVAVSFF